MHDREHDLSPDRGTDEPFVPRITRLLLPGLLLLSGFCGISYEILYTKLLGNLLGSPFTINATVLLTFLLGIGVGTLHAHRFVRHLWLIEASIGVYAAGVVLLYDSIDALLYSWLPFLGTNRLASAVVALALLSTPAFLVGCSVPLFAGYMSRLRRSHVFSFTYAVYNVGAALTALTLQFLLLRVVGLRAATLLLACVNVLVAAGLLLLHRRGLRPPRPRSRQRFPRRVLAALALASVASAVFQLMMIKVVEFIFGPFNETFALVLAVVLFGLALGSFAAGRFGLSFDGALLLGLGGLGAILAFLPLVILGYASLYQRVVETYPLLVGLKLALVIVVMGLPAVGFGATVPALLRSYRDVARESGQLLFCSSVANAAGFLLMAFVLHQLLDYGPLLLVVAALAAAAVAIHAGWRRPVTAGALALLLIGVGAHAVSWDEMLLYASHTSFHSVEELEEARDSRIFAERYKGPQDVFAILYRDDKPYFFINGYISIPLRSVSEKIVGATAAMLAPRLDDALVLGVGSGATAGTVGLLFQRTDAVEINRVILDNLHRMSEYNFDLPQQSRVRIIHDDGIHHIKTTDKRYSLILNTVTSPLYFSSSKLYTRDFFRLVRSRLRADGVYTTWIDGKISDEGLDIILQSLRGTFRHVWLTYLKSNYYQLVCSDEEIGLRNYDAVVAQERLRETLAQEFALPLRVVPYNIISTDALSLQGRRDVPVNTLDFPALEHRMAQLPTMRIRKFKERMRSGLDLRDVEASIGDVLGWDPGEFLLYLDHRISRSRRLSELLHERVGRQFGPAERIDRAYRDAASRMVQEIGTPLAYYLAGVRLRWRADYTESAALLRRALELDPDLDDARYELGKCYAEMGDHSAALQHFEAEWSFDADERIPLWATYSLIELGRYDEALAWLDRATEIDEDDSKIAYLRGVAYEGLDDLVRARRHYAEALRVRPGYNEARDALRRLSPRSG